jgi:hypothetical protein
MPRSEKSRRALAATPSSRSRPIAANTGTERLEAIAGRAVCATTQIVQEAASVWLGCWWVDSAATVHKSKDRARQADQRIHRFINSPVEIRLSEAYNGYPAQSNFRQVTMGMAFIVRE